jgi:hypothetical protein
VVVEDFERHATEVGLPVDHLAVNGRTYVRLRGVRIGAGSHTGKECEVAILRTTESPWAPQAAIQVRPHLVRMGERNSQASPLGPDWQYLSRRFERKPTPKAFFAHILTVLAEL